MLIPITVHVPERLVPDFYVRFGEFMSQGPQSAPSAPKVLESGALAPAWVDSDEAEQIALTLWEEVSGPGHSVLTYLSRTTDKEPRRFRPDEVAAALQHPKGASGIAGILGGVGKAIRRADLPIYNTPRGGTWHYVWDWDGEEYTMTPEVARLLRKAERHR